MRASVLKTETFESQSQLSRSRLWEVGLNFETKTETRIQTIFKTEATRDRPLDVDIENLANLSNKPYKKFITFMQIDIVPAQSCTV